MQSAKPYRMYCMYPLSHSRTTDCIARLASDDEYSTQLDGGTQLLLRYEAFAIPPGESEKCPRMYLLTVVRPRKPPFACDSLGFSAFSPRHEQSHCVWPVESLPLPSLDGVLGAGPTPLWHDQVALEDRGSRIRVGGLLQ